LTVQIAAARRLLEDITGDARWIETLPRRGYRYVGPAAAAPDPDRVAVASDVPTLTLPGKPSVAVLPFSNLSDDAEQDYFADGMVDDIITGLSRIIRGWRQLLVTRTVPSPRSFGGRAAVP